MNETPEQTEPTAPAPPPEPVVLQYVGGGAYIAGVPAINLTARDIAASGLTIAAIKAYRNGKEPLYVDAAPTVIVEPVAQPTDDTGDSNDANGTDGANGEEQ